MKLDVAVQELKTYFIIFSVLIILTTNQYSMHEVFMLHVWNMFYWFGVTDHYVNAVVMYLID